VLPQWADRRYDQISRRDVIDLLDAMVSRAPTGVNRVQSLLSAVFSFAIDEGLLAAHPCARLRRRTVERPRSRVLAESEIKQFWWSITQSPVSYRSGLCLRLMLMTGMRTAEVAALNRSELVALDDDQGAALLIPGSRIKNRRTLFMPLVGLGLQIVREAAALSPSQWVFPGKWGDGKRPMSAQSYDAAMRNFCVHHKGTWLQDRPIPHDLRRTCRTLMAQIGVSDTVAKAIMNRAPEGVDGKHYNHYGYAAEKRAALQLWSDRVTAIIGS
jgi:integrase